MWMWMWMWIGCDDDGVSDSSSSAVSVVSTMMAEVDCSGNYGDYIQAPLPPSSSNGVLLDVWWCSEPAPDWLPGALDYCESANNQTPYADTSGTLYVMCPADNGPTLYLRWLVVE